MEGLTARLARQMGESGMAPQLNPRVVAESFGQVLYPNRPLPESATFRTHAELDEVDGLRVDASKPIRPTPKSLVETVLARLFSITPMSEERKQEVRRLSSSAIAILEQCDELVATLEREFADGGDERWEALRQQGRKILDETLPSIQAELAGAMADVNGAEQKKAELKSKTQSLYFARQKMSRFASSAELDKADERLLKSRTELQAATDEALEAQRALAAAESKMENAKATLASIKTQMQVVEALLKGQPFFDPTTGLSVDPKSYRDLW